MLFKRTPKQPIKNAEEFTRDFTQLVSQLFAQLSEAQDLQASKEPLGMLANLAAFPLPQAKTVYGLALLMEGKPWFDARLGMDWLRKGAEEAETSEHDASFSMFQYGRFLLDGFQGVPRDPVTAKYWIDKAADAGYKEAVDLRASRWKS